MDDNTYELISHINAVINQESSSRGISVFIGAGADVSSGGILFSSLKKKFLIKKGYPVVENSPLSKIDELFNDYFEKASPDIRCEVLENLIMDSRNMSPSDGYKLLLLLAKEGVFSSVITTNFDNLMETTEKLLDMNVFQIFAPGISTPVDYYIKSQKHKPIYLKMHGDIRGRFVSHLTQDEIDLKQYKEEFVKLFDNIIVNDTLIFIGYSGFDTQITKLIQKKADSLKHVYWCNTCPPDNTSPLVQCLYKHNKLTYIEDNFDHLMQMIALDFFNDRMLFHTDSIFIWPLIEAKIQKLQKQFLNNLQYKTQKQRKQLLIPRKKAAKAVRDFIHNQDKNLCVLSGNPGVGKSCFIVQLCDQMSKGYNVVPITCNSVCGLKITDYIIENMGYITSDSFSVLYQFLKWINSIQQNIIFIIDNAFGDLDEIKEISQYINRIIELSYVVKAFKNVKFLIVLRTDIWNELYQYLDSNYLRSILWNNSDKNKTLESIRLETFSDEELDLVLEKYEDEHLIQSAQSISDEVYLLLHDPMLFGIVFEKKNAVIEGPLLNCQSVYASIEAIAVDNQNTLRARKIIDNLTSMAGDMGINREDKMDISQCPLSDSEKQSLVSKRILTVVDQHISFYYTQYTAYFYAKSLYEGEGYLAQSSKTEFIKIYLTDDTADFMLRGMVLYLSLLEQNLSDSIGFLVSLIHEYDRNNNARILEFVQDTLDQMAKYRDNLFYDQLLLYPLDELPELFALYVCYSTVYMDARTGMDSLKLLMSNSSKKVYQEAHTLLMDRIAASLMTAENVQGIFEKFRGYLQISNPLFYLSDLLSIMCRIGLENVGSSQYIKISQTVAREFSSIRFSEISEKDFSAAVEAFCSYSNVILFDETSDLIEKYYLFPQKSKAVPAMLATLNGAQITSDALEQMRDCVDHFNNNFNFLACNLIFISQYRRSNSEGCHLFEKYYSMFNEDTNVEELDFYLSALFMACYLNCPQDRETYLKYFHQLAHDFEQKLFENPGEERLRKKCKYSEKFDLEFEDSFNPLASYFYLAPAYPGRDDGRDGLKVYWQLLDTLEEYADYHGILRLIHALSQMISIWPRQGFQALSRFCKYEQPIIRKGLIRVLKENYIRYPLETITFMESTGNAFTMAEQKEIHERAALGERTFEQLHWCKALHFLQENIAPNIINDIIYCMSHAPVLQDALEELMKRILKN